MFNHSKINIEVIKLLSFLSTICCLLSSVYSIGQQPVLSVQRFDYIWQRASEDAAFKRMILASNDTIKQKIEKSFANALQQRWNLNMPENILSVKPVPLFSLYDAPKFNTKIKDRQQGAWYLFLQIFDKDNPLLNYNDDSLVTRLIIKCRLVDGLNDSIIVDNNLLVKIYKEAAQPDQVLLTKLQVYPADFIKAFDSIAAWAFQPDYKTEKSLWLKPACVFVDDTTQAEPINQLVFKADDNNIQLLSEPLFSFQTPGPEYKKTDKHKNIGGNSATGVITLFTGLNLNKEQVTEYNADFTFEEKDSAYHCIINYAERETAERVRVKEKDRDGGTSYTLNSKSYTLDERKIIPGYSNAITLNNDTLATFEITYKNNAKERKNYTRLWDGTDSATITVLPQEWNNKKQKDELEITGTLEGAAFSVATANKEAIKKFYINDKPAVTMYGKTYPSAGFLFQPLSLRQLKIFTILSSLPYSYFNYSAY